MATLGLYCCVTSLVAVSRDYSSTCGAWVSHCGGCSCGAQSLGHVGSVVVSHGLSCSGACGIFLDQELNTNALHWRRRQWHPTPVLSPGKSHGQRNLVGCSPWGREELDTTEQLHFHFSFHALKKDMATHSSVLAWRIPGMGEPGGLPSVGSHRVGHD